MGYYHRWIYSGMGKYTFKFHLLWRRRLLPDRTKQYFCHHPHAGICTNGHLFPVYIRLSGPASSLCRRLCLDSISYIPVLPVQGLPTSPSGRHHVLFVPLYRVGQSVLPATDTVYPPLLDRCIRFPGTHSKELFRQSDRLDFTLLVSIGACLLLR